MPKSDAAKNVLVCVDVHLLKNATVIEAFDNLKVSFTLVARV